MSSVGSNQLSSQNPNNSATSAPRRQALILAGGGAQGAYEVGIIKALLAGKSSSTGYKPLNVDVCAGTSSGSINASLIVSVCDQGPSAITKFLEETWLNEVAAGSASTGGAFRFRANPLNFMNPASYVPNPISPFVQFAQDGAYIARELFSRVLNLFHGNQDFEARVLELVDFSVLVSGDPLKRFLDKTVRLDKIRTSPAALKIVATDWKGGHLRFFGNEDMSDDKGIQIILASSAIPGLYPAVEIEGDLYVDGGVLMNTPLKPAIDAGASEMHIIYMQPQISHFPLPKFPNTIHSVYRSLVIGYGAAVGHDVDRARKINDALAFLQGHKSLEDAASPGVMPAAARELRPNNPYRLLTVHRYHPHDDLGIGWINFGREDLKRLIQQGFQDGVEHNCDKNQCLVPVASTST